MSLENEIEIAHPEQPHCPVVLVLDTSGSMAGQPIQNLQQGLEEFRRAIVHDELARRRVDLAIVTFGGDVEAVREFSPVDEEHPMPSLEAGGGTPMAGALHQAMQMLEDRKAALRDHGTPYYRPWLFLITDGAPTDIDRNTTAWRELTAQVGTRTREGKHAFYAVGVEGADMQCLNDLMSPSPALRLEGLKFQELFRWLSRSMAARSASKTTDKVPLENPLGVWAQA